MFEYILPGPLAVEVLILLGKKNSFVHFSPSQIIKVNIWCIVGNTARMKSKQRGVKCWPELITVLHWQSFSLSRGQCMGENQSPLPVFNLAGCLFNLSSERCLISTQNRCHIDLCLIGSHSSSSLHWLQPPPPLHKNPTRERESLLFFLGCLLPAV